MEKIHVPQVAAMEKLCFSTPWSENSIAGELENPISLWLVAMDGERAAGYAGSQRVMDEADVMNLAVLPEYRRQGLAAALMEELIRQLAALSCTSLTLEVRASNMPARNLYEKLGFVQAGRRPNYYRNPRRCFYGRNQEYKTYLCF